MYNFTISPLRLVEMESELSNFKVDQLFANNINSNGTEDLNRLLDIASDWQRQDAPNEAQPTATLKLKEL